MNKRTAKKICNWMDILSYSEKQIKIAIKIHHKQVLRRFYNNIVMNQQDMPSDFNEIIDKHFWDLV